VNPKYTGFPTGEDSLQLAAGFFNKLLVVLNSEVVS
jgi:hypothetical protein